MTARAPLSRPDRLSVRAIAATRWRAVHQDRWLVLFLLARGIATVAALGLLGAHRVTAHDAWLALGALLAGPGAMLLAASSERLRRSPLAWSVDGLVALGLVLASEDWRSPFYLLALSTLILPAVTLKLRMAALWGFSFVAAYLGVAVFCGLDARTLDSTIRLETLATHLLVPLLVVLALSYASDLLVRLRREEERARTLAIDSERRRIAWELHDSAKQRVHSAHLLLSSVGDRVDAGAVSTVEQALRELQAATADMDTSVSELQTPVDGRRLDVLVRERAAELAPICSARIAVQGDAPQLPATLTAHAYRIVAEALLNAVRHARADNIDIVIALDNGRLTIRVSDDGHGLPQRARPGAHGMSFMGHRAATIGARLNFTSGRDGRGTTVALDIPLAEEAPR